MLGGEPQSREELIEELRTAQGNGLLSLDTLAMIEGALRVTDLRVDDVMIPRAQMVSVSVNCSFDDVLQTVIESGHSRFPVHGEDRDEIVGILLAKDLLRVVASHQSGEGFALGPLLRPAVLIPESKRLNVLLNEFRTSRHHMALVVDEYGGVSGLITMRTCSSRSSAASMTNTMPTMPSTSTSTPMATVSWSARCLITDFNERFGSAAGRGLRHHRRPGHPPPSASRLPAKWSRSTTSASGSRPMIAGAPAAPAYRCRQFLGPASRARWPAAGAQAAACCRRATWPGCSPCPCCWQWPGRRR